MNEDIVFAKYRAPVDEGGWCVVRLNEVAAVRGSRVGACIILRSGQRVYVAATVREVSCDLRAWLDECL